jgi:hypothetical protein
LLEVVAAGVLRVVALTVDAGFQAEAAGRDAEVGAGPLRDVCGQLVEEIEGDTSASCFRRDREIVPGGLCGGHGAQLQVLVPSDTGHFPENAGVGRAAGPP